MHAPMDVDWLECAAEPVFIGKGGGIYNDASPGSGTSMQPYYKYGLLMSSGGPEGYGDTSPDPIQGVLPRVIEATNRVLM